MNGFIYYRRYKMKQLHYILLAFILSTVTIGTDDFLFESVKKNIAMFEENKIRVKSYIVPEHIHG
jgi:hypothetical protein